MPTGTNVPLTQDWDAVNVGKSTLNRAAVPKTARGLDAAKAQGKVATELRYVVELSLSCWEAKKGSSSVRIHNLAENVTSSLSTVPFTKSNDEV
jgi:hypothetical protein